MVKDELESPSPTGGTEEPQVSGKAARKAGAQRQYNWTYWFGLGRRGLVGWALAMPVLVGAGLGLWLDATYPASHSWMLLLMPIGLAMACFNAWRRASRDRREIRDPAGIDHDWKP